jgi:hypothetical protein
MSKKSTDGIVGIFSFFILDFLEDIFIFLDPTFEKLIIRFIGSLFKYFILAKESF